MDEKKYIKYTTGKITDKDDLELGKSFQEMAMEAVKHAFKEGIKANSIIINKDFVRVKNAWITNGFSYSELPDMICGLEVYLTDDELPDNYSFAVVEKSQTEREKLIGKTKSDTAREIFDKIFEVLCCFTTQGKSKEYNEGYIDCLSEVDKRLQNLAKEKYGVDLGE